MKAHLLIALALAPAVFTSQDTFMGREIARTMHFSGAEWLLRETREEEEAVTLLLDHLGVQPGMTVCDLGVGVGVHALPIARRVGSKGRVLGVDIQQEMLDMLAKRAADAGFENIVGILADETDPNLEPGSCDLILLVDVYHEISRPLELLGAMRAALKPQGRVALVEFRMEDRSVPIKRLHKMSRAQILLEWESHGFALVDQFEGLPWQHLMFFGRDDGIVCSAPPRGAPASDPARFAMLVTPWGAPPEACAGWADAAVRAGMSGVFLESRGSTPALEAALAEACRAAGLDHGVVEDTSGARALTGDLYASVHTWEQTIGRGRDLLVPVGLGADGRISPTTIESLDQLRFALDVIFDHDLAAGAFAHSSSVNCKDPYFRASLALDGSPRTFWAPERGDEQPWLTGELGEERVFNRVVVRESGRWGGCLQGMGLEWRRQGVWSPLVTSGVGPVISIPTVTADAVRITPRCLEYQPMIADLELYLAPPRVTIQAEGDTFEEVLEVRLESDAEGAEIRYTLDGSEPHEASLRYSRPLMLRETTTVRATAFLDGKGSLLPAIWTAIRRP